MKAWKSYSAKSASWDPGVGFTRRTMSRTGCASFSPANGVYVVSRLLALLAAELGQPVPAAAIAAHAGDPGSPGHADSETVWAWVCRVRRKIEQDPAKPELLLTVKGIGYRLTVIR